MLQNQAQNWLSSHGFSTCELICLKQLLKELRFGKATQMTIIR